MRLRISFYILACAVLFRPLANAAPVTCIPGQPSCTPNFGDYVAFTYASLLTVDAGPVHANMPFPDIIQAERNLSVPLTTLSRQYSSENRTASASSSASGSVTEGTLRASVSASADSTGVLSAGGIAFMTVGWSDTVRLLGASPATTYRFRFSLHTQVESISASGPMSTSDVLNQFLVFALDPASSALGEPLALQYGRTESTFAPAIPGQCKFNGSVSNDCSFVFESRSGQELALVNTLNPACFGSGNGSPAACRLDVSGGAYFTIEALDPGATYMTGSGLNYTPGDAQQPTPTPEPTTLLLSVGGLTLLCAAGRKMVPGTRKP